MEPNGARWSQMELNGSKWSEMEPNGAKWRQMEFFVGKNKVILGSMCVWCGYAGVFG